MGVSFRSRPMPLTLDLPPDVGNALAAEAERRGTTPEAVALDFVRQRLTPTGWPLPPSGLPVSDPRLAAEAAAVRTGADLVAYWERNGLLGTRRDIADPVKYARELREQAERRPAE